MQRRDKMGNKVNKQIGTCDKLQVKHRVHIVSSNIKQQSSFQLNLENEEQVCQHILGF